MYYSMKSSNQLLEKLQSELGHTWEAPLIVSGNYTGIVGPLSYFLYVSLLILTFIYVISGICHCPAILVTFILNFIHYLFIY